MGELQSNPALFALVKTHAKPITLTSDKIELAFRNDIFIDKIKVKQQTLEETAKKLCGKVPVMIFRKISDEDFKKKNNNKIVGVRFRPEKNKYEARIGINGKPKVLGLFLNEIDAIKNPKNNAPQSPMKILAGWVLNTKNPNVAPANSNDRIPMSI